MRAALSIAILITLGAAGCGGAPPPQTARAAPAREPAPIAPPSAAVIQRAALDEVLAAGPGRFLQTIATEADMRDGRFVGFRLTELRDEALFGGVDLAQGDTVIEVNGHAIERPEDAFTVWTSLEVASELSVVVLRGDERRELRFAIVD